MTERTQGQPTADRAVGRPGPAARMDVADPRSARSNGSSHAGDPGTEPATPPAENGANGSSRRRPSVLIAPVAESAPTTVEAPAPESGSPAQRVPVTQPARAPSGRQLRPKVAAVTIAPVAKGAPEPQGSPTPTPAPTPPAPAVGKQSAPQDKSGASGKSGPGLRPAQRPAPQPAAPGEPKHASTSPTGGKPAPADAQKPPGAASRVGGQAAAGVAAATTAVGSAARSAAGKARASSAGRVAKTAVQGRQGARAARLYLTHVDPWSVMKQAFLLSLALAVVTLVSFAALWFALESAGVLDAITRTATDVGGESGANVSSFLTFSKVMGVALIIAGIETVLVTALATLFTFLYNLAVAVGGGVELTLSEDA